MININSEKLRELQERINTMNPVDLAENLVELSNKDLAIWIKLLNKDLLADAFAELPRNKKVEVIESLSDENIQDLVRELDGDELVDTLQELPANMVRNLMNRFIDSKRRPVINTLLGYPEESVGSIMSVDFLSVKISSNPEMALEKIKNSNLDADRLEQIWITDDSLVLMGFVYLADIIRNREKPFEEFFHHITASVFATDDQEIVAKLARRYDLGEIPVTDSEGRLVGIVPAEWAIDVLHEEYEEDLGNIHGISESSSDSYWDKSSFQIAKERTTWLVICLITATMTGFIIKRYESVLAASVALTAYIPMLMDSGGNAGTQSSTTIIRSLYTGEVNFKECLRVIFKEFRIGIFVGVALVLINYIRMFLLDGVSHTISLTVSVTLLLTIILSKIIGGVLPLIADKLKIDPTIMAGPLITTIVDTFVLMIYFEVASFLLGL